MNVLEQGLLKYLSEPQLRQIQSVKIGIGGAGGLGSNLAMILTRTGFKQIEILDHDVIEPSNLNRQQYFVDEIGLPKVKILKMRLLAINPDLHVTVHQRKWTVEQGDAFFQGADFIIEAFDQAECKHQFVDFYHTKTRNVISGNGMAGLLEKQPMKIKQIGNIYIVGDHTTDAAKGHPPMAPRVTACASMMAEIVLDLTLALDNVSSQSIASKSLITKNVLKF